MEPESPQPSPGRRFGTDDVSDIKRYIKLGPLGEVFAAADRHVLLIDEIDKADLEFPNDLLRELDEMRFSIVETSDEIVARHRPIVMITSNNEKELPDAFLRRCIFYYIEFPNVPLMRKIIDVHHPHLDAKLLDQVLIKFYWLREQSDRRKKPSTSELEASSRDSPHSPTAAHRWAATTSPAGAEGLPDDAHLRPAKSGGFPSRSWRL